MTIDFEKSFCRREHITPAIKELQNKCTDMKGANLSRLCSILNKPSLRHISSFEGKKVEISTSFQKNVEKAIIASSFCQHWIPNTAVFKSFSERLAQLFAVISVEMKKTLESTDTKIERDKLKKKSRSIEKNAKSKKMGK